jgi:hypothetical protein
MAALEVDGDRPAVAWVSELPGKWLTPAERLILFAIACDSYDGYSAAPGNPNLVAWTGLQQSYLRATITGLCEPNPKRPALLRKKDNKGGKHATLILIRDALPVKPADTVGTLDGADRDKPADTVGTLADDEPADTVGTLVAEPAYKPAYLPADTVGTSLSLLPTTSLRSVEARAAKKPQRPTKRGTRLDPSWMPSREVIAQMRAECPAIDLQAEHRKFVDYWCAKSGKDATKTDWGRTWRNWIRNARPPNGRRPTRQEESDQQFDRMLAQARERDRAMQAQKELEP